MKMEMKRACFVIGLILFVLSGCATTNSQQIGKNDAGNRVKNTKCIMVFEGHFHRQAVIDFFAGRIKMPPGSVVTTCNVGEYKNYNTEVFDLRDLGKKVYTLVLFSELINAPAEFPVDSDNSLICQTLIHGQPEMCAEAIIYLPHQY